MVPSKILPEIAAELPTSSTSSANVAELPTPSTSSADVRSPVIAAPVGGFELTGAVGGWIDPGVAPVHPGRGEFESRLPPCRSGLCDPLFCVCERSSETRTRFEAMCDRRVRFDLDVEAISQTVTIGPCGERHAVNSRAPRDEVRYQHAPEIRHAARANFLK